MVKYCLILLFCLIECELVLYFADYPSWWRSDVLKTISVGQSDEILGWRQSTGQSQFADGNRFFTVTNWDNGGRATRDTQEHNGQRVALLGDSFMQGFGLDDHDTIGWLLQQRFPSYDFQNFACGGYGTQQVFLQIQHPEKLGGDLPPFLIYLLIPAQLDRAVGHPVTLRNYSTPPTGFFRPFAERNSDGSTIIRKHPGINVWELSKHCRISMLAEDIIEQWYFHGRVSERLKIPIDLMIQSNKFASKKDSRFAVVLLDFNKDDANYIRSSLDQAGIRSVDCSASRFSNSEYRLSDWHPNPQMAKEIALCIGDFFSKY